MEDLVRCYCGDVLPAVPPAPLLPPRGADFATEQRLSRAAQLRALVQLPGVQQARAGALGSSL
eukprot:152627-Alexandrium_andersonii.AAC.1